MCGAIDITTKFDLGFCVDRPQADGEFMGDARLDDDLTTWMKGN